MAIHGQRRVGAAGLAVMSLGLLRGEPAFPRQLAPDAQPPLPTAARLRAGASVPVTSILVVGGGEVTLDVTVSANGSVARIDPVRATPPYTEMVMSSVRTWRFDPARTLVKQALQPVEGHVLVMGVFRPPQVYAGPAPGELTEKVGTLSPELPPPGILQMPEAYPPRAVRDGTVLVEIELTAAGMPTSHRILSQPSAFDSAALETVRMWRFGIPSKPSGATSLFAYALVGFREPITTP